MVVHELLGLIALGTWGGYSFGIPILLRPVIINWLSRIPRLGIWRLVTLRRSSLEPAALDYATSFIRTYLPMHFAFLYFEFLTLSIGVICGICVKAHGLRLRMAWSQQSAWLEAAEEIQKYERLRMLYQAQYAAAAVQSYLKPESMLGAFTILISRLLANIHVDAKDCEVILCGIGADELKLVGHAKVRTYRSWNFEVGGHRYVCTLDVTLQAGSECLALPKNLTLEMELPRLRTLMTPTAKASKQITMRLSCGKGEINACGEAFAAFVRALNHISNFYTWQDGLVREEEAHRLIATPTNLDSQAFEKAVRTGKREQLEKFCTRLSAVEMMEIYARVKKWPVPEGIQVQTWIKSLQAQQVMFRGMHFEIAVDEADVEATYIGEDHGEGARGGLSGLVLSYTSKTLDTSSQMTCKLAAKSVIVSSGPLEISSVPVVKPMTLSLEWTSTSTDDTDTSKLSLAMKGVSDPEGKIQVTLSARSLWRLNRLLDSRIQALSVPQEPLAVELKRVIQDPLVQWRAERQKSIRLFFDEQDVDRSGSLDFVELKQFLKERYGHRMTIKELEEASIHFFMNLDADGGGQVSLEELNQYYANFLEQTDEGGLQLQLQEYVRHVDPALDTWATFLEHCIAENEDPEEENLKTLQTRWVRCLRNYNEAMHRWQQQIAPRLQRSKKDWLLTGRELSMDYYNDDSRSLANTLSSSSGLARGYVSSYTFHTQGMILSFAEGQHVCASRSRVRVEVSTCFLEAQYEQLKGDAAPKVKKTCGELHMQAQYFNDQFNWMEPFVEPWNIWLEADSSKKLIVLRAEKHMVINVTPSLLHVMKLVSAEMQRANTMIDAEHNLPAIPSGVALSHGTGERNVGAWVINATGKQVRVCMCYEKPDGSFARGKEACLEPADNQRSLGMSRQGAPVKLPRKKDMPLELHASDFSMRAEWQMEDGSKHVIEDIRIGVAGRSIYTLGGATKGLVVHVINHIEVLAPVVVLCGELRFRNLINAEIVLQHRIQTGPKARTFKVNPRSEIQGSLRPVIQGTWEVKQGDEVVVRFTINEKLRDNPDQVIDISKGNRLRVVLLNKPFLRSTILDRTFVLLPPLRIQNSLPCEMKCAWRVDELDQGVWKSDKGSRTWKGFEAVEWKIIQPGDMVDCLDADQSKPLDIRLEAAGNQYWARVPANHLATFKSWTSRPLGIHKVSSDEDDAAAKERRRCCTQLDARTSWEGADGQTAVLSIFARYWILNKTGREVEVCSGLQKHLDSSYEQVIASPVVNECNHWTAEPEPPPGPQGAPMNQMESLMRERKLGPSIALMRCTTEEIQIRARGTPEADCEWVWDEKVRKHPLKRWSGDAELSQATAWSESIIVSVANIAREVELDVPVFGSMASPLTTTSSKRDVGSFGLSIADMPPPFEGTKVVTIVPRYIIINGLEHASIDLFPVRDTSRDAPTESDCSGLRLPHLPAGQSMSIDAFPVDCPTIMNSPTKKRHYFKKQVLQPAVPHISIRISADQDTPGVEGGEDVIAGDWSVKVPLNAVGDSIFRLTAGNAPPKVCRASVQVQEATTFAVIEECEWPYRVENRSSQHCLEFTQATSRVKEIWELKCESFRNFVFPDLEAKPKLQVKIKGSLKAEAYKMDRVVDEGTGEDEKGHALPGLFAPLQKDDGHPALAACMRMDGSTVVLSFHDWEVIHPPIDSESGQSSADRNAVEEFVCDVAGEVGDVLNNALNQALRMAKQASKALPARWRCWEGKDMPQFGDSHLVWTSGAPFSGFEGCMFPCAVRVYLAGLHLCLIDTQKMENGVAAPEELIALTVDYVQLTKEASTRSSVFSIHHIQVDCFDQDDQFVFGPTDSGLNSRRVQGQNVTACRPMVEFFFSGKKNLYTPIYDPEKHVASAHLVWLALRPLEVHISVPTLLPVLLRFLNWLEISEADEPDGGRVLGSEIRPGFPVPGHVEKAVINIDCFHIEPVVLSTDVRVRGTSLEDEVSNVEELLQKAQYGVRSLPRSAFGKCLGVGATFAEASPQFRFDAFNLSNTGGTLGPVMSSIVTFYQHALLAQTISSFVGSLQLLGDPITLMGDVGGSVSEFAQKAREEVLLKQDRNALKRVATLGEGVVGLAGGVAGGTLNAASKTVGEIRGAVGSLAGQPLVVGRRAGNVREGFDQGMKTFVAGVSGAVTGVVEAPMAAAHERGFIGCVQGSTQGVIGLVTRPVEGGFGALEKVLQGVEGTLRGNRHCYTGLRRPPRVAFSEFEDSGTGLQRLHEGFLWPEWQLKVESVKLPALWSDRQVHGIHITLWQNDDESMNTIRLVKAKGFDNWALHSKQKENITSGRVGQLRGPLRLRVYALVEGNIPMSTWEIYTAAYGELPATCLSQALEQTASNFEGKVSLRFDIIPREGAVASAPAEGDGWLDCKEWPTRSEVCVELRAGADDDLLPACLLQTQMEFAARGGAGGAGAGAGLSQV